jgi:5'-deoxynucleotidase YfbR-like HD superfamily hydrolase
MQIDFDKHLKEIEFLLERYSTEQRATVNQYRWAIKRASDPSYQYQPGELDIHETLLEHVGMLPVLAVYFHPYLEEEVDLGKTLTILAVHDIGELVHGDINVFVKTKDNDAKEREAALELLHPSQHGLYLDYDALESNEAKFAKSVDKIAPDILDVVTEPAVTITRLKHYAVLEPHQIATAVEVKKSPYMQWSTFFTAFHAGLINRLRELYPSQPSA